MAFDKVNFLQTVGKNQAKALARTATFAQKKLCLLKKLLGETVIYGVGSILPRIITVALNYLFISHIDNSAFATFTNLYALISLVNVILSFGFETSYFRFSAQRENEPVTYNTGLMFLFCLSAVFLAATLLFRQQIANSLGYGDHPEYISWFGWIAFFDNLCVLPLAWLRFHNKPIRYSVVRVVQSLFQSLVVICLFLFVTPQTAAYFGMENTVSYPFFSNLLASILGFLLVLPIVVKFRAVVSMSLLKRMIRYSLPIMIAGLAFMINENFDKVIQKFLIDSESAGSYGGCYKMAVLMTLFVTAYRMGIEPYFFKKMNDSNARQTYAKVTEYFFVFAAVVALGIIANIGWLKFFLVPSQSYWIALDIVPIIVLANLCFGIYYNLSTWYKVTDRTYVGTYISWTGAAITIVLHFLFLKEFGFMVSAWVTFIAYFVMMVLSYFLGQRYYPIPYAVQKIIGLFVLLFACTFVISYFLRYEIILSNIILLMFTAVILFLERKLLFSRFKTSR